MELHLTSAVINPAPRVKLLNVQNAQPCSQHTFLFYFILTHFSVNMHKQSSLRNIIQKNANPTPPKLEVTVNQTRSVALLNV